jgi:hypothetical protein
MDLITVGWTMDNTKKGDFDKAKELIATWVPSRERIDEMLEDVTGGLTEEELDEGETLLSVLKNYLLAGLEVYFTNDRMVNSYHISGDYFFHIAGGGSWGDDPFDGWSGLVAFLDACDWNEELAEAAGYIGGGIVLPPEDNLVNGNARRAALAAVYGDEPTDDDLEAADNAPHTDDKGFWTGL